VRPRSVHNPAARAQRQRQLAVNAEQLRQLAEQRAAAQAARRPATAQRKATRQRAAARNRAARRHKCQLAEQVRIRRQELDRLARLMTQRQRPGPRWRQ
jgi:hypothetical protein